MSVARDSRGRFLPKGSRPSGGSGGAIQFSIRTSAGEVSDALRTFAVDLTDLTPFFDALRPDWYESRRILYDTQGGDTGTPWPLYSDTPERLRYVYAKASILGNRGGRTPDSDVLLWGGDGRLRRAVVGESSETSWRSREDGATMTVDVPYASNHDEGKGLAPEWAWPRGTESYRIPQRRLTALGGTFERSFSDRLAEHLAESGTQLGMSTSDVASELRRTYLAGVS